MQNLIERFSLVGTSGKDAMTELELRIRDQIYNKYHVSLSSSSISINSIFDFIIRAEKERNALRSIVIGNSYRLPEKTILSLSGLLKYGE
jgi:vacuolar-type H+-ATPase subunit C/Vma6